MNPFQKEVFIRLSDDGTAFACHIRYGQFYSKTTEFGISKRGIPAAAEDSAIVLVNRLGTGIGLPDRRTGWPSTSI